MVSLVLLALCLQEPTVEDLVKKLVEGEAADQKEAGDALVKKGKNTRTALAKAHDAAKEADLRKRIEQVVLRIDAGVDETDGKAGDVSISLDNPTLALETIDKKKWLHLSQLLRFSISKDTTILLTGGKLITYKDKIDLTTRAKDKSPFRFNLKPNEPRMSEYGDFIEPKWSEGTLAVLVFEFSVDNKKVKIRSPIVEVTTKKDK